MKIKYFCTITVITLLFTQIELKAQETEEVNNNKLKNAASFLNEAKIEKAEDAIAKVKEVINICPTLDTYVKTFESEKSEAENKIANLTEQRKNIDMSIPQIKINGTVEAKQSGYAIINSSGNYYAVKSDLNVGSNFNGSIIKSEGTITYQPLGGSSYTVQKYTQGSGSTPQEKYSSVTKELENYNNQANEQWNTFRTSSLKIINEEIQNNNTILIERYYKRGDEYLQNKDYESAFKEFIYVKNIDPNYLDIEQKIELSNNKNSKVKSASVYSIKSIGEEHYFISTSEGIYESVDGGKTWKINSYEGLKIEKFDVCEDVMMADIPNMGIMFGTKIINGNIEWSKNVIKYSVAYAKTKTPAGKDHYNREYQIIYPDFTVKQLNIIPYGNKYISFAAFDIKGGIREKGKKQFVVQENTIWKQYYIEDAGERLRIAETCLTPDFGKNWVTYWGTLLGGNAYFSPLKDRNEVLDMIDRAEEYLEVPEEASDMVKEYISEKKGIGDSEINIIATTYIEGEDIEDEDIVMVLTNYGLYRSCYDCEKVDEINLPKEYRRPLSVYYDKKKPNIIMVGFFGQGLIISKDNGTTWEEIYGKEMKEDKEGSGDVVKDIDYIRDGNRWIFDYELKLKNNETKLGKMTQEIIGDKTIKDKIYKEVRTKYEGIEAEETISYVRKQADGIYALYDFDLINEAFELPLPLGINSRWISENKRQYWEYTVTDIIDYTFRSSVYKKCFKVKYEGRYNGYSYYGDMIYSGEVGIIQMTWNFEGGYQELRLKELIFK